MPDPTPCTLLTALALATAAAAQGSVTTFGAGCTFQGQTAAIGHSGLPRTGQTFSLTYSGPNHTYNSAQQIAQPNLALGFQPVTTVIPAGLLLYQPSGCTGYLQPIAVEPMPQQAGNQRYETSYAMAIPNNAGLIGVQFLAQWVTLHTQCGFAGCGYSAVLTSDAAIVVIGP